jgi:hypothetical protein
MRGVSIGFLVVAVVVLGMGWGGPPAVVAAGKSTSRQSATDLVTEALRQESEGNDSKRAALLAERIRQMPESPAAYWHSGYVKQQGEWLKYDEVPKLATKDTNLAGYQAARGQYPETVDGQFALAKWCVRHKLMDQQRVHLTKVLELDPDNAEARRLLGYHQVDGTWLTDAEMDEAETKTTQASRALHEWNPKLLADRKALLSDSRAKREAAEKRLLAIRSPEAVEAIEQVFLNFSEDTAQVGVRMLGNIPGFEASAALARHAVCSPSETVRQAAGETLRSRPYDTFVPGLLSTMASPIQSRCELYQAVNGRVSYRHAFYREGQEVGQLAVFDTDYRPRLMPAGEDPERWRRRMAMARQIDVAKKAQERETAVARQNEMVQAFNDRVCTALSRATGQTLPAQPEMWWEWWNDYNEVYVEHYKPVSLQYQSQAVDVSVPGLAQGPAPSQTQNAPRRMDCLAAGTPVWTELGPVAIEKIRAGDRVLSQNVETGELAYKPVLHATIRPEEKLLRISTGDQPVTCSGGHPFWVSGTGWVKARDVKPENHIHGVSGTASPQSVDAAGSEKTYNLVVADFHTYFVGNARLLTHDNTVREPTSAVVPGLAASER